MNVIATHYLVKVVKGASRGSVGGLGQGHWAITTKETTTTAMIGATAVSSPRCERLPRKPPNFCS